jgi:hypothetical protein
MSVWERDVYMTVVLLTSWTDGTVHHAAGERLLVPRWVGRTLCLAGRAEEAP